MKNSAFANPIFETMGRTADTYILLPCMALFALCASLVSRVTTFKSMFYKAEIFNQDLSSWDGQFNICNYYFACSQTLHRGLLMSF